MKEQIQKDAVSAIVAVINHFNDVPHIQRVAQTAIAKLVGGTASADKGDKQAPDELRAGASPQSRSGLTR